MNKVAVGQRTNTIDGALPLLNQAVYYPTAYANLAAAVADIENLHVIVVLPGNGEWSATTNGSTLFTTLEVNELPKLLATSFNRTNCIYLCPMLWSEPIGWNGDRPQRIVNMLDSEYPGAAGYHITGLSEGGIGVYNVIQKYPNYFDTAGILCGNFTQAQFISNGLGDGVIDITGKTKIKAWHGTADTTVTYASGVSAINLYTSSGYSQEHSLVDMTGYTHNIWTDVYDTDELYHDWLDEKIAEMESEVVIPTHATIFQNTTELSESQAIWATWTPPVPNMPNVKTEMQSRADDAVSSPDADMMTTALDGVPAADGKATDTLLAAYVYYMTGDETYGDRAHDFLMTQIGLSIAEPTQYASSAGSSGTPRTQLSFSGAWYIRLVYIFEYCKPLFSGGEITTCETFFTGWANLYKDMLHTRLVGYSPNRLTGGSPTTLTMTSDYTHEIPLGNPVNQIPTYGSFFTNAYNNCAGAVGLWAAYQTMNSIDATTLNLHSRAYFEDWMKHAVFPDGTNTEYRRNWGPNQVQGTGFYAWVYVENIIQLASVFSRLGDDYFYEYSTTEGVLGTEIGGVNGSGKGSKNLLNIIRCAIENYTQSVVRHSTVPNDSTGETRLLNNPFSNYFTLIEVLLPVANIYYQDQDIFDTYMNQIDGVIQYTPGFSFPVGNNASYFNSGFNIFPDAAFWYGREAVILAPETIYKGNPLLLI